MTQSSNKAMTKLISNLRWKFLYADLKFMGDIEQDYVEGIAMDYSFNPVTDHVMTTSSNIFDLKKAAAMYFWYKSGSRISRTIIDYFDEYKRCVDDEHPLFNSNYGFYAYTQGGLNRCIKYLAENKNSRQACFCINNNYAMGPDSIDKLCTNAIHFFIRNNKLEMVVQMRSSNFLSLLPYDAFMFSVFYQHVYSSLRSKFYYELETGLIRMQVASLHMYKSDIQKYKVTEKIDSKLIEDFCDNNWQTLLEEKLINALQR